MGVTPGYVLFKMAYQLSPILLTGGIAQYMPGGGIPILVLTEGLNFALSLVSTFTSGGGFNAELDGFFANYQALPGGQLIKTQPATYPSATQVVAANAQVAQPKMVSMKMLCPAIGSNGGFALKLANMMNLQASLDQHNSLGGTYTVITPSYIYTNCLLTAMTDISAGETSQVQYAYQLDFFQPLINQNQIQSSLGNLLSAFTNGTQPSTATSLNIGGLGAANPGSIFQSGVAVTPALPGIS